MDVSQLAGMVSVGTLLAFTVVAISILVLRYIPPNEIPLPPSLQDLVDYVSLGYNWRSDETNERDAEANIGTSDNAKPSIVRGCIN
ncbi:hypothetical protein K1719_020193 [Acacia pycnantha]|nr:hypothetical protein K1719_020193 [Acacia pycnantha]